MQVDKKSHLLLSNAVLIELYFMPRGLGLICYSVRVQEEGQEIDGGPELPQEEDRPDRGADHENRYTKHTHSIINLLNCPKNQQRFM